MSELETFLAERAYITSDMIRIGVSGQFVSAETIVTYFNLLMNAVPFALFWLFVLIAGAFMTFWFVIFLLFLFKKVFLYPITMMRR